MRVKRARVIPCLTISGKSLVKTVKFKNPRYLGDPINAVRIFNDKEVDELIILDIDNGKTGRPQFDFIKDIVSEAFIPVAYGGGISSIEDCKCLFSCGVEKIILNTANSNGYDLLKKASKLFGKQSVVTSIDVKKNIWGQYNIFFNGGKKKCNEVFKDYLEIINQYSGEVFLCNIDIEGTMKGFDYTIINNVKKYLSVPLIVCGGAGNMNDVIDLIKGENCDAVAAGSIFVYHGKHQGILINYPDPHVLDNMLGENNDK